MSARWNIRYLESDFFPIKKKMSAKMVENRKNKFYELTRETLCSTTFHGLLNMVRTKNRFKFLVWLLFASTIVYVVLVLQSINDYFNYEWWLKFVPITKIRSYYSSVTFCRSSKMDQISLKRIRINLVIWSRIFYMGAI